MAVIPFPPLQGMSLWVQVASSLAVGAVLLVRGGRIHRIALTLAGVGVGYAVGGDLAVKLGADAAVGRIAGGVTVGLLALIGARIVWAVLAAMTVTAVVVRTVGARYAASPPAVAAPADLAQWAYESWDQLLGNMLRAWQDQKAMLLLILIPAVAVPLFVGLLRPRLTRIVMTSLLGAVGLVAGALAVNENWWNGAMARGDIVAAVVAMLVIAGMIIQYRCALKTERGEDEPPAKKSDDDNPPPVDGRDNEDEDEKTLMNDGAES